MVVDISRYNISPFLNLIDDTVPQAKTWRDLFVQYFNHAYYDLDEYYDLLLANIDSVRFFLQIERHAIDSYTGLATFDLPVVANKHSFNLAYYISRKVGVFYRKKIMVMAADYGIVNIQIKLCGLNLLGSDLHVENKVGAILTCILNHSPPYRLDMNDDYDIMDVLFVSNIFDDESSAWNNWNLMLDNRAWGKQVFFTSDTFLHLKNFVDYDRIKLVENPLEVYDKYQYGEIQLGLMNKIYEIRQ